MTSTTPQSWAYRGTDVHGKAVTGKVDARTEVAVAGRLRAMGISPSSIREAPAATGLNRDINLSLFERGVGLKDLAIMSRQLATMISAGLSLLRALTIIADQTENKRLAQVLGQVRADVESGTSLSDALAKHPVEFPPLLLNLIRAGEIGGFLEDALVSVANNYESEVKLRGTIRSAMTYPLVVLAMALVAVVGMLVFIVPVFDQMFQDFGGELPLPTQALVTLSNALTWLGPVLIAGAIAFWVWWARVKNSDRVRQVVDPWMLRLPVFGPLLGKIALARVTRNLATMLRAGVPILTSLNIVGATSGNFVVQRALARVEESVRHGRSIAGPLADEPIFPSMVTQMIAVGEDSGSLEQMLTKVSTFYDQEIESTTSQLTSLIEPLMIAVIGVVVGAMIVALYLPIFSIFDQIR
jgi:type IV pilus assembly protein PilC